jgi:Ca2+/Na+ antiporter
LDSSSLQKEIFSVVISVRYLSFTPLFLASANAFLIGSRFGAITYGSPVVEDIVILTKGGKIRQEEDDNNSINSNNSILSLLTTITMLLMIYCSKLPVWNKCLLIQQLV